MNDRQLYTWKGAGGPFDLAYPYEVSVRPGGLKLVYCGIDHFREVMEDPR